MERVVRAVPVKSREALMKLAADISAWPQAERQQFLDYFGRGFEEWYFQEIEGKPYLIAVAEGENLEAGFSMYPDLDDPFFNWFREQVIELSGVDLRQQPKAANSEHAFTLSG